MLMTTMDDVDGLLADTLHLMNAGVDSEKASAIVADALGVLGDQVAALREATQHVGEPYRATCPTCHKSVTVTIPARPETVARALSLTAKMIDDTARLIHFTQGKPDSRPGSGQGEWLKALTNEQFAQVQLWVEDNLAHATK